MAMGRADTEQSQPGSAGRLARRLVFVLAVGIFALAVDSVIGQWILYSGTLCRLLFY